jgi:hypothetical protein
MCKVNVTCIQPIDYKAYTVIISWWWQYESSKCWKGKGWGEGFGRGLRDPTRDVDPFTTLIEWECIMRTPHMKNGNCFYLYCIAYIEYILESIYNRSF